MRRKKFKRKTVKKQYIIECPLGWFASFSSVTNNVSARLANCEIPSDFKLIVSQGHPRSLILVAIESAYAITLDASTTVFEIIDV